MIKYTVNHCVVSPPFDLLTEQFSLDMGRIKSWMNSSRNEWLSGAQISGRHRSQIYCFGRYTGDISNSFIFYTRLFGSWWQNTRVVKLLGPFVLSARGSHSAGSRSLVPFFPMHVKKSLAFPFVSFKFCLIPSNSPRPQCSGWVGLSAPASSDRSPLLWPPRIAWKLLSVPYPASP